MHSRLLLVSAVLLVAQLASAGHVYVFINAMGIHGSEQVQQTVRIDDNNGDIENVTNNFVITGGFSITYGGISSFNDDQGIFYYVSDWPSPLIFSADVNTKQLLPPVYVPGNLIQSIKYDNATGNLYALVLLQKRKLYKGYVFTIPQTSSGKFRIAGSFNLTTTEYGTDAYNDQFFVLTKQENATQYDLVTMYLGTGNHTVDPLPCSFSNLSRVAHFLYDPNTNNFYIVVIDETNTSKPVWGYSLYAFNRNDKTCHLVTALKLPKESIAFAFTFDHSYQRLWVGVATEEGYYLYAYLIPSGALYKAIALPDLPLAIEFSEAH